jgi:hypothetical protein
MALSNTISALTKEHFIPLLQDNIFNSNPLTLKLLKNAQLIDGGVKINQPVEVAENGNSGWLAAGTAATTAQALTDIADKAVYDWATAYNAIVISSDEQHINMGANQVLNLLTAKMQNAENTLKNLFGTGIFASSVVLNGLNTLNGAGTYDGGGGGSSAATAKAHDNGNGLIHDASAWTGSDAYFIPEGAVANSIIGYDRALGGINSGTPGTNDYWNSNLGSFCWAIGKTAAGAALNVNGADDFETVDFAKFCTTTSGVADGIKAMTQMYNACQVDSEQVDLIVTTPVIYAAYETALQAAKRWDGNSEFADAGFQSLAFKGASVVHDSHCPAGHMYFLNTSKMDFKVHSKRNFSFEDYRPMETKDGIQSRIFWMGQLVTSAPRYSGLLVGGPTGY